VGTTHVGRNLGTFDLINLSDFKAQTSLELGRDRVVGILLALFMMWRVFDRLWGASAAVEMKKAFVADFHLLAAFVREPTSKDLHVATARGYALRETISKNFGNVRALAEGFLFEFGPPPQSGTRMA
jgi:multidrug resistance protein MdtO